MLVLSRRAGETIQIGPNITIMLTEIRGDKARIGIKAPRDVMIVRSELIKPPSLPAPSDGSSDALVATDGFSKTANAEVVQ